MDHSKRFFKGKCPHCSNIIEFHSITFLGINDFGEIISTCIACSNDLSIRTSNPSESYIVDGAREIEVIDYEIQSPSTKKTIIGLLEFNKKLNAKTPIYDVKSRSLYCCKKCKESLELLAYDSFELKFQIFLANIWHTQVSI